MSDDNKKVITISREFGSGGRLIGRRLAEKLGVPYYDKELLDKIAEDSGFSKEMIEGAEKRAKNSFLYSLASAMGTGEAGPESLSLNERFFLAQFDSIRKLAQEEGSCVIVGRCADYILRDRDDLINIFITASVDNRISRAIEIDMLPKEKAAEIVLKKDKTRANYYKYHVGERWDNVLNYDLAIRSDLTGIEGTVKALKAYLDAIETL